MGTWTMRADPARNRLYGMLEGFFTAEEMKKCADDTIEKTKQLRPGYCTVTDVTKCKPMPPEAAAEIERVLLATGTDEQRGRPAWREKIRARAYQVVEEMK